MNDGKPAGCSGGLFCLLPVRTKWQASGWHGPPAGTLRTFPIVPRPPGHHPHLARRPALYQATLRPIRHRRRTRIRLLRRSTSSSTFDLPITARDNLANTLSFVLVSPLSRVSFFSLLNRPNNPIALPLINVSQD